MKVTVIFGDVKIVVPCGDGDLNVKDLGLLATSRYKTATGKSGRAWVDVVSLKAKEGGMLFQEDRVNDVCDDREELIAEYEVEGVLQGSGGGGGGNEMPFGNDRNGGGMKEEMFGNGRNGGGGAQPLFGNDKKDVGEADQPFVSLSRDF